ncbi:MAG: hypothetical protein ACP5QH_06080 [Thermoplasmata archaeon]
MNNISKVLKDEVKCLIVRDGKVIPVPFPPEEGDLLITGSVGIYPLEQFIKEIEEVISKRTIDDLIRSGLISYFITSDELVYREGQYMLPY